MELRVSLLYLLFKIAQQSLHFNALPTLSQFCVNMETSKRHVLDFVTLSKRSFIVCMCIVRPNLRQFDSSLNYGLEPQLALNKSTSRPLNINPTRGAIECEPYDVLNTTKFQHDTHLTYIV